jgi:hypothetical protein
MECTPGVTSLKSLELGQVPVGVVLTATLN